MINEATKAFVSAHANDDVHVLALRAKIPPDVDLRIALVQIEARQRLRRKTPRLAAAPDVVFPERLPLEQCSSEETAAYKTALVGDAAIPRRSMLDLTGGFGVDFIALSGLFDKAHYVERDAGLCSLAIHNFVSLGITNAEVHCAEAEEFLNDVAGVDFVFIDPARRSSVNRKCILPEDCSPDVTRLLPLLRDRCGSMMIKLSPMLDTDAATSKLGNCTELHVVAVNDEVKEILMFFNFSDETETKIKCSDIVHGHTHTFSFTMREERSAVCEFADELETFLYEPDSTLLKAGAFKLSAIRFGLKKLHPNTHLYTADTENRNFFGKIYKIENVFGFSKTEIRRLCNAYPRANIKIRNFPLSSEELRHRLHIKDGGNMYIVAATLASGRHVLICGRIVQH